MNYPHRCRDCDYEHLSPHETKAGRWWSVMHSCHGSTQEYPTLHWADEPEAGAGPREAFECDACGDRYAFYEERERSEAVQRAFDAGKQWTAGRSIDVARLTEALGRIYDDPNWEGIDPWSREFASMVAAEYEGRKA